MLHCQLLAGRAGLSQTPSIAITVMSSTLLKTWSLKEDASKYQSIKSKQTNTLKASKVGHCALWSSWLSCLQLWHKAYPSGVNDRELFPKAVKETKHWFCLVQKAVHSGKVPVLAVCYYLVLSGPQQTLII